RDRVGDGDHVVQQPEPFVDGGALLDQLLERAPRDQLHHVERRAVRPPPRFVDRHDARMFEPRRDHRLAEEPGLAQLTALEELLDRDAPTELAIVGARYDAEPTATVLAYDLVAIRISMRERRLGPVLR